MSSLFCFSFWNLVYVCIWFLCVHPCASMCMHVPLCMWSVLAPMHGFLQRITAARGQAEIVLFWDRISNDLECPQTPYASKVKFPTHVWAQHRVNAACGLFGFLFLKLGLYCRGALPWVDQKMVLLGNTQGRQWMFCVWDEAGTCYVNQTLVRLTGERILQDCLPEVDQIHASNASQDPLVTFNFLVIYSG